MIGLRKQSQQKRIMSVGSNMVNDVKDQLGPLFGARDNVQ